MTDHLQVPYRSIPDMFLQRVAATPSRQRVRLPEPERPGLAHLEDRGRAGQRHRGRAARASASMPEDRVAIASNTRVEWILADLGIMCAGAATTTVYPTTEPKDAAFILRDSGSKVLIAEDAGQVAKLAGADLPGLTHIVLIDGTRTAGTGAGAVPGRAGAEGRRGAGRRPRPGHPDRRRRSAPTSWPRLCTPPAPPARRRASSCCTAAGAGRAWPRPSSASFAPTTCSTCGCRCRTRSARR